MKVLLIAASLMLASSVVQAQEANWGQEVSECNQTSCYDNGAGELSRGDYVSAQAQDSEGPGYGQEIHALANPGKSDPKGKKFQ